MNDKVIRLLEQLSKEMASAGYFYAMVTVGAGGQLSYTGNVCSTDGEKLMRGWLEGESEGIGADVRYEREMAEVMAN